MAFYEDARSIDLLAPVAEMIDSGRFELQEDGTIPIPTKIRCGIPWIWAKRTEDRKCVKWIDIYWEIYRFQSEVCCNKCLKVVVRPKDLLQLRKIVELQEQMGLPAKAGVDRRPWSEGGYGAYWYCPIDGGLEGAKRLWARVDKAVRETVAPDLEVILKRGCTEMEIDLGPSDKWEFTGKDRAFEELLESVWLDPLPQPEQSANLKLHIQRRWVEMAAKRDETYRHLTAGPMFMQPVTYHKEKKDGKDNSSRGSSREEAGSSVQEGIVVV